MEPAEPKTSGAGVVSPPTLQILPWFEAAGFERSDDDRYARLRLSGRVRVGTRAPDEVEIVVCRGERCSSYAVSKATTDRHGRATFEFALPPALDEDGVAAYRLRAHGRDEIALPAPSPALIFNRRSRLGPRALSAAAALTLTALMGIPAASIADGSNPVTTVITEIAGATETQTTVGTTTTDTDTTDTDTTGTGTTTDSHESTTSSNTGTTTATTPQSGVTTTVTTSTGAPSSTTGAPTTGTTPTTSSTTTTPVGGTKHGGGRGASSTGSLSAKSNAAISNGIAAGTGGLSLRGQIKKTAALKNANGNEPAPKVLAPLPQSDQLPSSYTLTAGSGGGIFSGTSLADSWGGSMVADPFTALQLAQFARQIHFGQNPPRHLVKIYKQAAHHYRIPWQVLAAINYIETAYGTNLGTSSAGAEGWMQFEPSTWTEYGEAVTPTGKIIAGAAGDPYAPRDAVFSAARLLVADGARKNLARAVFGYNHAGWYVQEVLTLAERITAFRLGKHPTATQRVKAMLDTAQMLRGITYVWGGGHTTGDWVVQVGYDCSGFVSAVLHAGGFLTIPQTTQTLPSQAGILPGPGRHVTIFDRTDAGGDDHVIVRIAGQWWEEGGGGPAGAAMVHRMRDVSSTYLASFNLILHPKGL